MLLVLPPQGWLFDPATGESFVNTEAMREALRLWVRYMAVSLINPNDIQGVQSCPIILSSIEVSRPGARCALRLCLFRCTHPHERRPPARRAANCIRKPAAASILAKAPGV